MGGIQLRGIDHVILAVYFLFVLGIGFFLIVLGFAPLVYLGMRDVGGWTGLAAKLGAVATENGYPAGAYSRAWAPLASAASNPMGVEWPGMVMGLGFVLSFGYWCTDFLVIQRAMAARSMAAARRTPLIAAVPKMVFPFLIVFPGMIAIALTSVPGDFALPAMPDGSKDYTMVIPAMLARYFPNGLLGLGLTALMASFMSGMAGNVTAFNTVWTYDIYQTHLGKNASDEHLLWVGRGRPPRPHLARGRRSGDQGRMARRLAPARLSERDGPQLRHRHRGVDGLFPGHDRPVPSHEATQDR